MPPEAAALCASRGAIHVLWSRRVRGVRVARRVFTARGSFLPGARCAIVYSHDGGARLKCNGRCILHSRCGNFFKSRDFFPTPIR